MVVLNPLDRDFTVGRGDQRDLKPSARPNIFYEI